MPRNVADSAGPSSMIARLTPTARVDRWSGGALRWGYARQEMYSLLRMEGFDVEQERLVVTNA